MCGIIAYLGHNSKKLFQILYGGLQMIQNRGYDSAGLCSILKNEFNIKKVASTKDQSALDLLKIYKDDFDGHVGIAHTRWATHGAKTDANAHPHIDFYGQFALVHNGIIENYSQIKKMLMGNGYQFRSETDTEVIVNLISYYYRLENNVETAINKAISQLEGTWALCIITTLQPTKLYLCKNGSPILLGFNENEIIIASEIAGFCNYIRQYIILENHDILSIQLGDQQSVLFDKYAKHQIDSTLIESSPSPYDHWMLKEIEEQPRSLQRAFNYGGRLLCETQTKLGGLERIKDRLDKTRNLLIIGCGTSYHAGLYGSIWFKELMCFDTVCVIDAGEFTLRDLPVIDPVVIVLSQSGETKDVHRAMELIKQTETPVIGVINVVDSLIARECDCGVYLNAGREVGVASTKSFTSQCLVLILIAIWFSQGRQSNERKRQKLIQSLGSIGHYAESILATCHSQCQHLAELLSDQEHCFVIGRDLLEPIAREGSLKLKEIGYIHAEGYSGGALKHGPFALIQSGTPIILLLDKKTQTKMESAIEEVKSRGAFVYVISPDPIVNPKIDYQINLNVNNELSSLLAVLPLQLTSYYLSLKKGNNPDFPRNLAKVVTVDG